MNPIEALIEQLDLSAHIEAFSSFFSRPKPLYIEGDQELHYRYIMALDALAFRAPPKVAPFGDMGLHLQKQGVLRFEQIFELLKVVRTFRQLKNSDFGGLIGAWMEKIKIPSALDEIDSYFNEEGHFNESMDATIYGLTQRIGAIKSEMREAFKRLIHTKKNLPYLVDTQIHFQGEEEALLLRGGFNHVIEGKIIGRSSAGFFYVVPQSILSLKAQMHSIEQLREAKFYEYAKRFSLKLREHLAFIGFIDREFDRFDHYQARVHFARAKDLQILKCVRESVVVLEGFAHPALHKPKSVHLHFTKNVLMITGVNAGGKTMLLKSILSAALMARYLIPMRINAQKSRIGNFKQIYAIIDDPQNVRNDISTFAGRMQQFCKLFMQQGALVGVDEIELGTDSDEAAALFKVILDDLIARGQKIVVTTHHKRLAALMADRDDVELMAALYDEKNRLPTYQFLQGIIGKSYAFETAQRYGINASVIARARALYGDNSEKLNQLIERGSELERNLKRKHAELSKKLERVKQQERLLKEEREALHASLKMRQDALEREYFEAIREAKEAARAGDMAAIHRRMNEAHKRLPKQSLEPPKIERPFKVGEHVKYRKERGVIVALKSKEAMVKIEGIRLWVRQSELKHSDPLPKVKPKVQIQTEMPTRSGLTLDLHGMRAEEAEEAMDRFLSDALLQGWDEVVIYHGIGTGKLSYAVKNFLKAHPSVKSFDDAPQNMGGFGAKVVRL